MDINQRLFGLKKILDTREDMSDLLFHFTKGPNAFDTLCQILTSGKLKSNHKGHICFTETPLKLLLPLFEYFIREHPSDPMYAPYGIGINKKSFFEQGGRPVIYGSLNEKSLLNKSIQWRFQELVIPLPDFSWLREWRINKNEIKFSPRGIMIITKTEEELNSLCNILVDNTPEDYINKDGAFFDIERKYMGVSMEALTRIDSKHDLTKILRTQLDELS